MFTVAQILQEAPPSELHFFSPLGAGGAGAMPRRMRTAYSRMRCLPHPKGWASTPSERFCVALTPLHPRHFSVHIAPVRTAGRCGSPHPKGWASTPSERFCVALTPLHPRHFSVHIAPVRTAGRCGSSLSRFCPSPLNPPSGLPLPLAFAEHPVPKLRLAQG